MREILVLQLGGFGNKMGVKFWEEMYIDSEFESDIDLQEQNKNNLLNSSNILFYNLSEKTPLPRTVQVDLGQDLPYSNTDFNPCNQFSFNYSSGNNFGFVKNNCCNQIVDIIFDRIRQEIEQCDSLQGFQIFASIIGAVLSQMLNDEYSNAITQCNLLVPSVKLNDNCVVSPYNSALAFNQLIDSAEQLIFFDNEGLKQNLSRLGIQFDYQDANLHVAQTICCNSSPFRNPGDINSSLRKLSTNLSPFAFYKLFTCNMTNNLYSDYYKEYLKMDEYQIFKELISSDHNQTSAVYTQGKFVSAALSVRGKVSNKEFDKQCSCFDYYLEHQRYRTGVKKKFEGINMFFTNICQKKYQNYEFFGSSIIHSSSITQSLKSLSEKFKKMYPKKSYVHKYIQEGIEESEFVGAQSRLDDTIFLYQDTLDTYQDEHFEYQE
ncbi:unnamed protein product (macronuclear) [Paramecium tetraurelia]|uniref:Tubulin beta chain n=1 Tax=Paramecium tetraurelia TaxID=5888 RepID=A0BDJ3_PARTE|nr:uncharacterized protein GSPATT00027639001 [Paramecium tetraurelia]CAK56610.1 unnamed protein product [Paramecium tetraurelia]|eukprot:XP_001424008.1 hypothetical protein (macronuclear) [Paramecium tetraurelia strain d4-2]